MGENENDKTESRLMCFFLPLPVGIDRLVSGMSQNPAVRRLQNY